VRKITIDQQLPCQEAIDQWETYSAKRVVLEAEGNIAAIFLNDAEDLAAEKGKHRASQ
jgi:hypothetical protein